ncbi:uncharacterized protein [Nicotiana tomentosiformis]|uniref:uncharacterized protein isoform X5 n=1 Tax=Nicotiana tomentosiformis TaxID=4098 RepID=UPI00388C9602
MHYGFITPMIWPRGTIKSSKTRPVVVPKMAHHEKNRSIKVDYIKSGWSVSQAFNECLSDILKLTPLLLVDPKPVLEDEIEDRWKWFKMAHHEKNRSIKVDYIKSGWSVSQAFNECLSDILKLTPLLLVDPKPVLEDEIEDRWKWFKGCLGALDGTYIQIRVPSQYKPRYRTRKKLMYWEFGIETSQIDRIAANSIFLACIFVELNLI